MSEKYLNITVLYNCQSTPFPYTFLLEASGEGIKRITFNTSASLDEGPVNQPCTLKKNRRDDASTSRFIFEAMVQLEEYFLGKRKRFSVPVDLTSATNFQKSVWNMLCKIPYGKTISYKEIARRIGKPKAVRAVGNACAQNPVPVLIPCHRVIRSNGKLGGFSAGLDVKRRLLEIEGVTSQKRFAKPPYSLKRGEIP